MWYLPIRLEKLSDSQRHELAQKLVDQQNADQPLISEVAPIEVLLHEYANNRQFYNKVRWLKDQSDFVGIRRLKGDGNCFYRAFGFAYIHTLLTMNDRPLHHFTTQHLGSTLELLKQAGFEEDVVKDFYEPFQKLMAMMHSTDPATPQLDEKKLFEVFNDPEKSNSIVVYLRLLTSAFLKVRRNILPATNTISLTPTTTRLSLLLQLVKKIPQRWRTFVTKRLKHLEKMRTISKLRL